MGGQSWSCEPCRRSELQTKCTKSPGGKIGNNDPPTPPRTAGTLKTHSLLTGESEKQKSFTDRVGICNKLVSSPDKDGERRHCQICTGPC